MKHIATFVVFMFLTACTRHYDWHQRITMVIDTPNGEARGSVVQAVEIKYFPKWMQALVPGEISYDFRGEALVVDIGQGQYVFALLSSALWAEGIYRDLGKRPDIYRAIEKQKGEPPRTLSERFSPRMVTFGDIRDPESVQIVDRTNLAATFGPGYALLEITFESTRDSVTEGRVAEVLHWLADREWLFLPENLPFNSSKRTKEQSLSLRDFVDLSTLVEFQKGSKQ